MSVPADGAVGRNGTVLLVEDDDAIGGPLSRGLERQGFAVTWVQSGAAALLHRGADLVLLDLGLPDLDGIEVCRRLREGSRVPIIVLSARGSEVDRVVALELGADDYLVKPFGFAELVARMRAVRRRVDGDGRGARPAAGAAPSPAEGMTVGGLTIDRRSHRVQLDGQELALTPKEFGVLALLAADAGAVVTRARLIETVWDPHWYGPTKTLDVHVASLRKKLGDPRWIETVRSVGFRLVEPGG